MSRRADEAIVLRLSDYSETSQIVSLMTRNDGQVRLIAKGAKRSTKDKPSVGLDLLEYGDVSYATSRGDGLGTLTEWRQRDTFRSLRGSLPTIYAGLYASELTAATVQEHDAHPELFEALLEFLSTLAALSANGTGADVFACAVRFQANLLKSIGYAPNLRQCVGCGRARDRGVPAWFSSHAGGMLCESCQHRFSEKHPLAARLLDSPRGTTDPKEWFALLDYHLSQICGRPFASGLALRTVLEPHKCAL